MKKWINLFEHYKEAVKEKAPVILEAIKDTIDRLKQRKLLIPFIAGLVILCVISFFAAKKLFFGKKAGKAADAELVQVKAQKVRKENYTETYAVMGTIKGAIENELRFEIDGVLASYNFHEGDKIRKGQIICSLDPKDAFTKTDFARSKYTSEKSAYYSTSQRLKVYEDLFRMKAISESKIQEARYETQSAEARVNAALSELELAQSNLAKTNLVAPSEGLLAEILVKPGDYVTPQDVIAKYISGGETNFEVDVPEKDVNKLKSGQKVKINCDSYPDKDFIGAIKEIAPTVKERTRTTMVKVGIPNNDGLLRSGMFGRGTVYLVELENVIQIPNGSIVTLGESTTLIPLVKPDPVTPGEGIIEMRHVATGTKLSQATIIKDGLVPDELVVVETQGQLSDGIRVKFTETTPTKPLENAQLE